MTKPRRILFTVTNDLNHDQRMIRICSSLANAGYEILLIGARNKRSLPLSTMPYRQVRLWPVFSRGFGFYASYNLQLFFTLLFTRCDAYCGIDLDTLLPVWLVSRIRGKARVYDAHEFFSQQKEVITRPRIHRFWKGMEKSLVPRFKNGYTVSQGIAEEFTSLYGVHYILVRNLPLLKPFPGSSRAKNRILLYQGAVNEARGLEFLVPAMAQIDAELHIYGDGNFLEDLKKLILSNNLSNKVLLHGMRRPEELEKITPEAFIGLNLVENTGSNQYHSLANKFFDYIHGGIPQVTMNFPEYRRINEAFEVAVLIDDLEIKSIVEAIQRLQNEKGLHSRLAENCLRARQTLNWQLEEPVLLKFYRDLFEHK
ncbi:MAG: glycosyltransferase [Chitinophagaceae bacterium]|nr:glycosyltransferase [Chitinophagaceae bacterium]MBL0056960.1 glycosyltransferase [Chitinophagaceae bacterium]